MGYKFNNICFTDEQIDGYKELAINKIFAALGIYEDCVSQNDLSGYYRYLNRICTEFDGIYSMFGINTYLQLVGILQGMIKDEEPDHKTVKSLVFHCISIIKKAR